MSILLPNTQQQWEKTKAMEKHNNLEDNKNNYKRRKISTSDTKNFSCSSEMIFNIQEICNIILNHLQFSKENYSLFIFYGNHNYFKRRLKNISKADAINIYQKSRTIESNFHFLIQFHSLFKTMFGERQFQKILQTPWKKQSDDTIFIYNKWYIKTHGDDRLTLELNNHNQVLLEQMLNQKIKQFCKRFQIPLKKINYFRFHHNCTSICAGNHFVTFTLNTQKELILYSCDINIDSNLHTHELLPSLHQIKIWNRKDIEVHVDHDPSISTNLRFIMYRYGPWPTIFLKIKIPHQNLSVCSWRSFLKTHLFQKFPFKFFTEEIEFISKFKKDFYAMPNFKCVTRIDSINKGIIRVIIEEDTYHITLKNNTCFQCIGFTVGKLKTSAHNMISFSISEIPTHWKSFRLELPEATHYELKWDTIPSNLRQLNIIGGIMNKTNSISTVNWSGIPQRFKFEQRGIFLDNPIEKFNFLCNPTIIEKHEIKKKAEFNFRSTNEHPICLWESEPISRITYNISKFNEVKTNVSKISCCPKLNLAKNNTTP